MSDVMTTIGNAFLNWAIQIWNACMNPSYWILAVPIALAIMARVFDLLKRFLGK